MSRTQKLKGLVAASLRVKNIKRQSLFIPRFCPAKRQSTGQVATSEYHSRRASPENNKKKASQVRYNLTRFAGSWLRGYQSCKLPPEIVAYISKYK